MMRGVFVVDQGCKCARENLILRSRSASNGVSKDGHKAILAAILRDAASRLLRMRTAMK
jgi:hypothetical protein